MIHRRSLSNTEVGLDENIEWLTSERDYGNYIVDTL